MDDDVFLAEGELYDTQVCLKCNVELVFDSEDNGFCLDCREVPHFDDVAEPYSSMFSSCVIDDYILNNKMIKY